MRLFFNSLKRNARTPAAIASIKTWTRAALGLGDDTIISVNELACSRPGCSPRETVILVLHHGTATRLSIHKAIDDIHERDVIETCRSGGDLLHATGGAGAR